MAVFRTETDHIYRINDTDDGAYFTDGAGHLMSAKELSQLPMAIYKFIDNFSSYEELDSFIKRHNAQIDRDISAWTASKWAEVNGTEKTYERGKAGHVYMLECGGKYKIGFSANVKRRIKQLDTRPYPLKLVASSKELNNAYDIEQEIHEKLSEYKVSGEWYDLPGDVKENVADYIYSLEELEV